MKKGEERGQRKLLKRQLEVRLSSLPLHVVEKVEQLPLERLVDLCDAIVRASSLRELGLED